MREITKYVANDGTEFDNEDECRYYEVTESMKTIKGVKFFFGNGEEITNYSSLEDLVDLSSFIKITDKNDFNKFEEMVFDELHRHYWAYGWDDLKDKTGLFYYDEVFDGWMSWDEQYDKLREIRRKLNY